MIFFPHNVSLFAFKLHFLSRYILLCEHILELNFSISKEKKTVEFPMGRNGYYKSTFYQFSCRINHFKNFNRMMMMVIMKATNAILKFAASIPKLFCIAKVSFFYRLLVILILCFCKL